MYTLSSPFREIKVTKNDDLGKLIATLAFFRHFLKAFISKAIQQHCSIMITVLLHHCSTKNAIFECVDAFVCQQFFD